MPVLDCANASATRAMGVFYGCIRGRSALTGKTLIHRGMVYVIEGDIFLLSHTALKDLGVIPATFPRVGEFGGIEQQGDGQDRFEFDVGNVPRLASVDEKITWDTVVREDTQRISQNEVNNKINNVTTSVLPAIRQLPGECNPESDLPCSCPRRRFADLPDQLPMPATRSNIQALEGWIKDYFKDSHNWQTEDPHQARCSLLLL